jgi:hypothetical protein
MFAFEFMFTSALGRFVRAGTTGEPGVLKRRDV